MKNEQQSKYVQQFIVIIMICEKTWINISCYLKFHYFDHSVLEAIFSPNLTFIVHEMTKQSQIKP